MARNDFLYDISITGSNISALITKLVSIGLVLHNVNRDKNSLFFSISEKDYRKLSNINLDSYQVKIIRNGGTSYIKSKFIANLGIIIGLILSIILYFTVSNRVFYIKIMGLEKIDKTIVEESLESVGIKFFSKIPDKTEEIKKHLEKSFAFSLVSVITKGNALIVNVKEELDAVIDGYSDIVAEFDMVIKDIVVYSGTPSVQKGDIVRNGETLVFAYNYLNNEKQIVKPKAKIVATKFISKSYNFQNEEEIQVRTGESQITKCDYYLGSRKIVGSEKEHTYDKFEKVETRECISKYFLPIYLHREVVYELKIEVISKDFDAEKDSIISALRQDCLLQAKGLNIISEKENITNIDNGYVINYYIETEVYLNY